VVVPFLKVTVPVGAGTPEAPVTVAVKVTLEPTAMEVAEAVNAVVVVASETVTVTALETDAVFPALPG
jgi:hypothetical protein